MLKIRPQAVPYHGWQIEVVRHQDEFSFQCYPPNLPDFCNDGTFYSDCTDALEAARHFIDREIAIQSLLEVVGDWWQLGKVSEDEYWNLTSFD